MRLEPIELGRQRTDADGCRRYRPISMSFDTRNMLLDQEPTDEYEPAVTAQLRTNQATIRMQLLAALGTVNGEAKINNYRAMGPAPWSIVFEHNNALEQIRSAFSHGDFFPALVGACALGERIFNQLIFVLRDDYLTHPDTMRRARTGGPWVDWPFAIDQLHRWGILDENLRDHYNDLKEQRHASLHFDRTVQTEDHDTAHRAIKSLQEIIDGIFNPHGGPPRWIANVVGASYFSLAAEEEPLVKRVFLPRSALVSPCYRMSPSTDLNGNAGWQVLDDVEHDPNPLTDAEFAAAVGPGQLRASGIAVQ